MSGPLVSIVVATRNSARILPDCLSSIERQSYRQREIVVIDGASADGTPDILRAAGGRIAYWSSEPDTGLYNAWNKAIAHAKGEWLCFLGADDAFADGGSLEALVRAAAGARGARVIYGRANLVSAKGTVAQTVGKPWPEAREDLLAGFMLPHPATLHHRSLFEERGSFDESYRIAGDYELLLRELARKDAGFVDRVVVNVRLGGMSSRAEAIHAALREVSRARRAHGLGAPPARLRLALATSWIGARLHRVLGERAFNRMADLYRVVRGKPRVWSV
jgi:glycosyltransferase involved in cell wall biosynthesis